LATQQLLSEKHLKAPQSRLQQFFGSEFFYNYRTSPVAIISSLMILSALLIAVIGPLFTPQNPYLLSGLELADAYKPPAWIEGGDVNFLLGTDQQGRDILSAIVYGSRVSLFIGFVGVFFAAFFGIMVGLIAGYVGGRLEAVIMRIADIQLSFPSMLIALFLMTTFGRSILNVLIALTLIGWVRYARIVRGETLTVKKKEYIEASKVIGFSNIRILIKQVLPNVLTSVIVLSTIQVGSFILIEATLSFLGLGVPVTRPTLGMLCSDGFEVLYSGLWWVSFFPGLYIVFIVFGINLFGDFLRDELNPKLK
jgi:peptide/nickel transport system permease protein